MLITAEKHYYSAISTFYIQPGSKTMFIGKHRWLLTYEPKEENGDCLVSMEDLAQLFSPDWKWTLKEDKIQIALPGMVIVGLLHGSCGGGVKKAQ